MSPRLRVELQRPFLLGWGDFNDPYALDRTPRARILARGLGSSGGRHLGVLGLEML